MSILSSGLETADYGMPLWNYIYSNNMKLLNDTLLKIQSLLDVNADCLHNGVVIFWDASRSKWITRKPKRP